MTRVSRRQRVASLGRVALLPPAAFAVHQLRYMLAYGGHAGVVLERTGHSYLHSLVPWIMLAVAIASGGFLLRLGKAFTNHTAAPRYARSLLYLWLACAASLIAIFCCQEFLEGLFATGHPAGLAGIFGYGGWWAIPVAVAIGLVLAAVMHGALWALRAAAQWAARRVAISARRAPAAQLPSLALLIPHQPLVAGWSGRGPPA